MIAAMMDSFEDARMLVMKEVVVGLMSFPLVQRGAVGRTGAHRSAERAS